MIGVGKMCEFGWFEVDKVEDLFFDLLGQCIFVEQVEDLVWCVGCQKNVCCVIGEYGFGYGVWFDLSIKCLFWQERMVDQFFQFGW